MESGGKGEEGIGGEAETKDFKAPETSKNDLAAFSAPNYPSGADNTARPNDPVGSNDTTAN